MRNYANSIIYKLCCNDAIITDIYIGSTTNFVKRKQQHKTVCNNPNSKHYNYNVYQFIRANGGWESWNMVEIERYNAIDKRNLETRERYWLETLKASLNSQIPSRTKQEFSKQYYDDNKTEIAERHKQNYIDNKTEIAERHKQNYIDNKTKVLEKITCMCGAITSKCNRLAHMKTKKCGFAYNLHTFIYL